MDKNIDKGFTIQIIELENGWIKTQHGIFTPNEEQRLSACEVYEKYLYDLENPPIKELTFEEKVEIIIENQKAILAGDMQTLAYNLYPNDFNKSELEG